MRRPIRAWAGPASGALLLVLAAGASASVHTAGGAKYVTKSSNVPSSKTGALTAACPKGTHVLGGGEVNDGGYGSILLRQTFPYDSKDKDQKPDDGWKVRLSNTGGEQVAVKAEAVCAKTKVKYVAVRFVAAANTETGQWTATCPPGRYAYDGGWDPPAKSKMFLNSSFPSDPNATGATAWGVYVDNPTATADSNATVFAVCGKSKPVVTTKTVDPVGVHTETNLKPSCPGGSHAWGGGLSSNAGFEALHINSLGPFATGGTPGAAWLARADTVGPSPSFVTAYAVCGPKLN